MQPKPIYPRPHWFLWAVLVFLAVPSGFCRAGDWYYLLVFGSESTPKLPRFTHTWATFVKVSGPCAGPYQIECQTISWYAAKLELTPWRALPECGVNLDLPTTLRLAREHQEQVWQWGPYQIRQDLYDRACRRIEQLQRGELLYKTIDVGFRSTYAVSCIHAVSDLDREHRQLRVGLVHYGAAASYQVVQLFRPWMFEACPSPDWLNDRLGLRCDSIVHRNLDQPP